MDRSINFHFLGPSRRTGVISSQPVATKIILSHYYLAGNEIKRRSGGEAVSLTKYSTANVDPLSGIDRSSSPKESEISLIVLEGFLGSSLFLIYTPVTLSTIGFLIAKYFTSMTIKVNEILLFLYSWSCIFDNYSSLDRRCRFSLFLAVTLSTTVHHFLNIR